MFPYLGVGAWPLISMGATFGCTLRAPLAALVFAFELTHDLNVLPELMVGSVAGLCVTVLLLRRSILTEKLARRGQHLTREYSVDIFEVGRVSEVMDRTPPIVDGATTVAALAARIARGDPAVARRQAVFLTDEKGRLAGILTRGDLLRAQGEQDGKTATALAAGTTSLVVAYPDETLHDAMGRMLRHNVGRLPVVAREDPNKVVGYLGRADILSARVRDQEEEEKRERGPLVG